MGMQYPGISLVWEGEFLEEWNKERYLGLTYNCPDVETFDSFDDYELFDNGLIDNVDFY
jgi:hypothetical protein